MDVTKPQAVIRPTTSGRGSVHRKYARYKTASGNQAYNFIYMPEIDAKDYESYKTASGNQAYNMKKAKSI